MLGRFPSPSIWALLFAILSFLSPASARPSPALALATPLSSPQHQLLLARPAPSHVLRILDEEDYEHAPTSDGQTGGIASGESSIFTDFLLAEAGPSTSQKMQDGSHVATTSFRIPVKESGVPGRRLDEGNRRWNSRPTRLERQVRRAGQHGSTHGALSARGNGAPSAALLAPAASPLPSPAETSDDGGLSALSAPAAARRKSNKARLPISDDPKR